MSSNVCRTPDWHVHIRGLGVGSSISLSGEELSAISGVVTRSCLFTHSWSNTHSNCCQPNCVSICSFLWYHMGISWLPFWYLLSMLWASSGYLMGTSWIAVVNLMNTYQESWPDRVYLQTTDLTPYFNCCQPNCVSIRFFFSFSFQFSVRAVELKRNCSFQKNSKWKKKFETNILPVSKFGWKMLFETNFSVLWSVNLYGHINVMCNDLNLWLLFALT